jgi:MOSC domain-containing protein YiiM
VGGPKSISDERGEWVSSILRERVAGPVRLLSDGFAGDKVAQPYHGGPEAAVCVHLAEHYEFWRSCYGVDLGHGYLGENLVLEQVKEADVFVGDQIRIGSALVQVSGPRVPCENQARRVGRKEWVRWTIRENRTGFYLRVLEPGLVKEEDRWVLERRINQSGSISVLNEVFYLAFDASRAEEMAEMQGLANWWKHQLREKSRRQAGHWSNGIVDSSEDKGA